MDLTIQILQVIYIVILIIASGFYLRHLEKTKKQRKLTTVESRMHIAITIAYLLFGASILLRGIERMMS